MKSKMMKRYEKGGPVDDMEAANQSEDAPPMGKTEEAAAPEYKSFKEAFAAERKAGNKTFEYMGKKYTTDMAAPRKEAAKAAAPKAESAPAPKAAASTDVTKMSLAERAKASRESARSGSGATDTRSVGERLRTAMAGKDRGGNTVDFAGSGVGLKNGGVVRRATVKSHGKAC
jgi:hypothetical protein